MTQKEKLSELEELLAKIKRLLELNREDMLNDLHLIDKLNILLKDSGI